MGLTVGRSRLLILASTSLLTGSITAFCGPIGFIGIAVPHLTRSLLDTADHRLLIPATCLTGTILLLHLRRHRATARHPNGPAHQRRNLACWAHPL